jgi:hypothetical protein
VVCHPHVVEDEPRPKAACAHPLGDGVRGFLEGREDPDREAAEARDIFCSESGSDAVFIVVPIDEDLAREGVVAFLVVCRHRRSVFHAHADHDENRIVLLRAALD